MNFKIGDFKQSSTLVTENMVNTFANISGDHNPIHLDLEYASNTIFKEKIAHGMLISGFISALIANEIPGNGSIYLKQNLEFKAPVKLNDVVTTKVTILNIEGNKYFLQTDCFVKEIQVIQGTALILKK
jgi:3-hydroxybutyryl-CoA dehydratase